MVRNCFQITLLIGLIFTIFGVHQQASPQPSGPIPTTVEWHPTEPVLAVALDMDGDFYTDTADQLWLYDNQSQPLVQLSLPETMTIFGIKWSGDGQRLAVLGVTPDFGQTLIYLWNTDDLNNPTLITNFETNHSPALDMAWHGNHNLLATTFYDDVYIWDVSTNQTVSRLQTNVSPDAVSCLAWHPTTNFLAGGTAEAVFVWDADQNYAVVNIIETDRGIQDIAWSPTGDSLAVAVDKSIEIWNWNSTSQSFQKTITVSEQTIRLRKLVWQQDRIASISPDNSVFLWDTDTWQVETSFTTISSVDFPHTSTVVALSNDGDQIAYLPNTDLVVKTTPTANPGPDQTLTDTDHNGSELVTLDATASTDPDGTIDSYEWLENGIVIAEGEIPQVELALGEHIITLKVTDNDGLVDMAEVAVKVDAP